MTIYILESFTGPHISPFIFYTLRRETTLISALYWKQMLVALVSAYRYEGTKVKDEIAEKEAQALSNAIKNSQNKPIIEHDEVIRILATRSKPHIQAIYKHYNHISGKNLDEVYICTNHMSIIVLIPYSFQNVKVWLPKIYNPVQVNLFINILTTYN